MLNFEHIESEVDGVAPRLMLVCGGRSHPISAEAWKRVFGKDETTLSGLCAESGGETSEARNGVGTMRAQNSVATMRSQNSVGTMRAQNSVGTMRAQNSVGTMRSQNSVGTMRAHNAHS